MRNEIAINHQMLRAAQNKAVIARFIGDSKMWLEANKEMKSAINLPWYRLKWLARKRFEQVFTR
jgi:hypothetical protein